MADDFIGIADAATVKRLARIIRDGTAADCIQAFNDVTAGNISVETWDAAAAVADGLSEAENAEGGAP